MAKRRKLSLDDLPIPKKVQTIPPDGNGSTDEETHSDSDCIPPNALSTKSDVLPQAYAAPISPASTKSVKYPSELKTHYCPFKDCTKAFNRPARLQEHLRSHNNERLFKCTQEGCDKTFLRSSHLSHHLKSAHTSIRDYVCDRPGCGKGFVTASRLRRHLVAHDGRDKFRCTGYPPCDQSFRKHSTLQRHIVMEHLKRKPFPCSYILPDVGKKCQMAFDTLGHLRAHESRVHAAKRFSCAECSLPAGHQPIEADGAKSTYATFSTYTQLQEHIRAVHPPQCPVCPVICSTSRELRRHLEVAHGDISVERRKLFPCTVPGCDSSFTKKGNLTVHIRTVHDGEKRFVCGETDLSSSKKVTGWTGDGCGKRYGSKLALEEHIRTVHLGYMNAKAERRQRLGLDKSKSKSSGPSTISALTGEGYAEEGNRHITCFSDSCAHRFQRDYDLWVHMSSRHGLQEDEIQDLFLERALLGEDKKLNGELLGIYGQEFDTEDQYGFTDINARSDTHLPLAGDPNRHVIDNGRSNPSGLETGADTRSALNDAIALVDPALSYNMADDQL